MNKLNKIIGIPTIDFVNEVFTRIDFNLSFISVNGQRKPLLAGSTVTNVVSKKPKKSISELAPRLFMK